MVASKTWGLMPGIGIIKDIASFILYSEMNYHSICWIILG